MSTHQPPDPISYGKQLLDQSDIDAVIAVLRGERLTQGDGVRRFEQRLAQVTGAEHALAVTSGTTALQLAYMALDVGPGSRVTTTANTFLATATAAIQCGAEVRFLDIEPHTANLDLDQLERELRGPSAPDVVTIVHFAGLPCDMQRVLELKREFGFRLVEDAAHALGANYDADGRSWRVGEHPEVDVTTLSFHPVKHITTGEGGAVLTHDAPLAARLRRMREHGVDREATGLNYAPMIELGINGRLSDINAALGWSQLAKLPAFLDARRRIADRYVRELCGYEWLDTGVRGDSHAFHLFVVRTREGERDHLRASLRDAGIHAQLHYQPVPSQPWFRDRYGAQSVPCAEAHARCALSLPIHPGLSDDDQQRVIDALHAWRKDTVAA